TKKSTATKADELSPPIATSAASKSGRPSSASMVRETAPRATKIGTPSTSRTSSAASARTLATARRQHDAEQNQRHCDRQGQVERPGLGHLQGGGAALVERVNEAHRFDAEP